MAKRKRIVKEKLVKEHKTEVVESPFSEEDLVVLKKLSTITSATPQDKELIAQMYKKYIDASVHVCTNCDEPIRLAYKRVMSFYKAAV